MSDGSPARLLEPLGAPDPPADTAAITRALEDKSRQGARSRAVWERLIAMLSPLLLLVIWETLSRAGLLDARFFPAPSSIAGTFMDLLRSGALLTHTWATLFRVGAGLAIGCSLGVAAGILLGLVRMLRLATLPILAVTMPIPKIALLPLLALLLGIGDSSKVAIVAVGVFFIMVYNTMAGVITIPHIYLDVGQSFGAGRLYFYRTVALPGALPMMLTGFKLSFAVGLLIVVPAEWSGVKQGLGYMIFQAWNTFDIPEMYVGLIALGLLGYVGGLLLEELERKLVPWRL